MDRIKTVICIAILIVSSSISAEQTEQFKKSYQSYQARYNFFSMQDTLYTIDSELELPDGYKYVSHNDPSAYPFWVANFPIWHQYKAVGHWKGGKAFEYDEVSRVIHLPWKGPVFKDVAVPVRILGEYNFQFDNRFVFQIMPKKGEVLTYKKWLNGKPVSNQFGEVFFKDDVEKEDTEDEYYRFLLFSMQNVSYESIAKSCDTVAIENVQSGDMFIAYDKKGKNGKLFIIFRLISNDSVDIMYLVANGCPQACDLHIPKFNNNRDNPWIKYEQLQDLVKEFDNSNFYRFRAIENNSIE